MTDLAEYPSSFKKSRWPAFLLAILPLWLFGSGGFALWQYFENEKKEARETSERFARSIASEPLEDDLHKIITVIGERNSSSETAGDNLSRTAAMIEGLLGPSNTGYQITKDTGPAKWPLLYATLPGLKPNAPTVWIVTSYDSPANSRGGEVNASGLAATLAVAQAMANSRQTSDIFFVFLPHANHDETFIRESAARLSQKIRDHGSPKTLLYVESMGASEELWISSPDASFLPSSDLIENLGSIRGGDVIASGGENDFTHLLAETKLPAIRISTRPLLAKGENDDQIPSISTVAATAGKLAELIRRYANP